MGTGGNNQCGEWHKEATWELPKVVQARNDSSLGKGGGNEVVKRLTDWRDFQDVKMTEPM